MRTRREAKETTRRLIKAGIAVGILGGGAATHMDAWAEETEEVSTGNVAEIEKERKTDATTAEVPEDVKTAQDELTEVWNNEDEQEKGAVNIAVDEVESALDQTGELVKIANGARAQVSDGKEESGVTESEETIAESENGEEGKKSGEESEKPSDNIEAIDDQLSGIDIDGVTGNINDEVETIQAGLETLGGGQAALDTLSENADDIVKTATDEVNDLLDKIAAENDIIKNASSLEEAGKARDRANALLQEAWEKLTDEDLKKALQDYEDKLNELEIAKKDAYDAAVRVNAELKGLYTEFVDGEETASDVDYEKAVDKQEKVEAAEEAEEVSEEDEAEEKAEDVQEDQVEQEIKNLETLESAVLKAQEDFEQSFGKIAKIDEYIQANKALWPTNAIKVSKGKVYDKFTNEEIGTETRIYNESGKDIGSVRICEVDVEKEIKLDKQIKYSDLFLEIMRSYVAKEVFDGATLTSMEWHGYDISGLKYDENGKTVSSTGGDTLNYYVVTFVHKDKNGNVIDSDTRCYNYKLADSNNTNNYGGIVIFEKPEEDFGYVSFQDRKLVTSETETDYIGAKNNDYSTRDILLSTAVKDETGKKIVNVTSPDENTSIGRTVAYKNSNKIVDAVAVTEGEETDTFDGVNISKYYIEGKARYHAILDAIATAKAEVVEAQKKVVELEEAINAIKFEEKTAQYVALQAEIADAKKDLEEAEKKLDEEYEKKASELNPGSSSDNNGGDADDTFNPASVETAQEEGGSVLGANREQPVVEETVEEGGSVLGAERGRGRSPKTGDASNALGAVATMGTSLVGAASMLGLRRRNK